MTDATAHWRTLDGVHRTASSTDKTVSVDIEAECDLDSGGEGGIDYVEFYVSVNGGAASTTTVSVRDWRVYNSTDGSPNGFTRMWTYGITVDCAALAGGTITVDASVFSAAATETALPTLTIYNDTDGVDRRPNSQILYVDLDSGNDTTGDGSMGNPFKYPRAAMNSVSGDVGGLTIRFLGRVVSWSDQTNYTHSNVYTSGAWAITFEAVGADKTIRRLASDGSFADPQDYILGASGAKTAFRFVGFTFVGPGPTVYLGGTTVGRVDEINCTHQSHNWDGVRNTPHVEDEDGAGTGGIGYSLAGSGSAKTFSWSSRWRGVARGFASYSGAFDFDIGPFLSIAIGTSNTLGVDPCFTNGEIHGIRYSPGHLDGLVQTQINFTHLAGVNVTISVQASGPHAGKMRIDATNSTPNDFGTAAQQLVGSTRWGVLCRSATGGGNNGCFFALEGGTNSSGFPYCILDNSGAIPEVGSSTFAMFTAVVASSERYIDRVHTDILQIEADHVGAMFAHIRAYDCEDARSWVGSGRTLTRCVFKNLTDGSHSTTRYTAIDFGSGTTNLLNCLFLSMSINSPSMLFTGTFTGTNFVDCVVRNGANFPTVGVFTHSCHFLTGATSGTNPSSGAWFAGEPGSSPFSFAPSSGNLGTASGLQDAPAFWRFSGATGDSRGAWRNVATGNWSTSQSGSGITPSKPSRFSNIGFKFGM